MINKLVFGTTFVYLACCRTFASELYRKDLCYLFYIYLNYLRKHTFLHSDERQQLASISIFKWITALYINRESSIRKKITKNNHDSNKHLYASLTFFAAILTAFQKRKKNRKTKEKEQLEAETAQTINNTVLWYLSPSDSKRNFTKFNELLNCFQATPKALSVTCGYDFHQASKQHTNLQLCSYWPIEHSF